MKNILIVIALALAALCALLLSQKKSAGKVLAEAKADTQSLSNQLAELKTRVTEQTLKTVTCQDGYSNKVAEVHAFSNRLAKTTATLEQSRTEARSAQAEVQRLSEKSSALERQASSLAEGKAEIASALESTRSELATARQHLHAANQRLDALTQSLNQTRAEKDELSHHLDNLPALEARLADLRAAQKASRSPTKPGVSSAAADAAEAPLNPFQKNVRLQLQPDGSVKLVKIGDQPPVSP